MLTSRQSTMENTRSFDDQKSEDSLLFQPTSRSCFNFESNFESLHHYTQYKRKSVEWTADFENEQTSQSARNRSVKDLLKTMRSKMSKHGHELKLKTSSPSTTSKLCGHSYSTVHNFDGGKHRDAIFLPKCDANSSNTASEKDEPVQWKKFENFAKIFGNKRKARKRLDSHVEFGKHNNSTSEFGTEVLPYFQRTSEKHDTVSDTFLKIHC
ncbi:unnamed protein product [Trichobilharzia szidati]|nr:unnamed protein product [Trichobilharzia szidati]